jgi:hypothetical protein
MARAQLKIDVEPSVTDQGGRSLPFVAAPASTASPARILQDGLLAKPAADTRWPIGQRVALIVSASLALWVAILHATAQVAQVVA